MCSINPMSLQYCRYTLIYAMLITCLYPMVTPLPNSVVCEPNYRSLPTGDPPTHVATAPQGPTNQLPNTDSSDTNCNEAIIHGTYLLSSTLDIGSVGLH